MQENEGGRIDKRSDKKDISTTGPGEGNGGNVGGGKWAGSFTLDVSVGRIG